ANVDAHYYLADTLVKLNRRTEARTEYEKVLALAPGSPAAKLSRMGLTQLQETPVPLSHRLWRLQGDKPLGKPQDRYIGTIGDGDTYLQQVTESNGVIRWSFLKMPLKVYLEMSPLGVRNFQPAFPNRVRHALDVWMGVLDHQLSYTLQNTPDGADI